SLFQHRRVPAVAGAAAAGLALIVGLWVTARAMSPGTPAGHRATQGPIPGASMPRASAPSAGMPGAEQAFAPPQRSLAPATSTVPGAALPATTGPASAAVPQPPPANAWPGLRGAYPPAPQAARPTETANGAVPGAALSSASHGGHRSSRSNANGYLAPAQIQ